MRALDPVASRLSPAGRLVVALVGGAVAVVSLFGVGLAVRYGHLPSGSFLLALLLLFLVVAAVAPIPESGPEPEPHPVWQRELADDPEAVDLDADEEDRN